MEKQLSSKQVKYLKSQAHSLKPLVQIGKSGLSDESIQSIVKVLADHELIKIKFIAHKEEQDQLIDPILQQTEAQFVCLIGHVLTIYRRHTEPDQRKYHLPS